ncbi:hypothetical protein [Lentilactobacillus farraginis]|uniref:Uncharacterized protein n=1 Tax=Lentilactobacillus farraginis DSM 18382 = JCM 14108 TaxID=1423743 RepID=X0PCI3_9LACO|nr:hypothetical protein [Lentilactobacillus farraginis]GAF38118.1 hypothetical protein JCM14108_3222 [Lentilactobacillus farraginis DSM 18382 = JCM 14108]
MELELAELDCDEVDEDDELVELDCDGVDVEPDPVVGVVVEAAGANGSLVLLPVEVGKAAN